MPHLRDATQPLTDSEIEERRRNLAFIRRETGEDDYEFTTTLKMQEQWLFTVDHLKYLLRVAADKLLEKRGTETVEGAQ